MKVVANTAEEYVAALPPERGAVLAAVRQAMLEHLPPGLEEVIR